MKTVTFEDIKKANESIVTTTLTRTNKKTGVVTTKEYAEVNQRIKAFRMVYPTGTIRTEMISNENGVCIFRAMIFARRIDLSGDGSEAEDTLLATGTAYEKESSSLINNTSYIENCETSAIGRALGIAGFGIDTAVASYEEVQNAIANQDAAKDNSDPAKSSNDNDPLPSPEPPAAETGIKATSFQVKRLASIYTGKNLEKLLAANKVNKIEDLSMRKASELIEKIEKKGKK